MFHTSTALTLNASLPISSQPDSAYQQVLALAKPVSPGHHDELLGGLATGTAPTSMTAAWATFFAQLSQDDFADLHKRQQSVTRQLRDNGVSYNVYADQNSLQRPWSLDLFPLLITPQSWATIEAGVLQRAKLLNLILSDLYGAQNLLHEGFLPPALVQGHPGYLRSMTGHQPAGGTWLHIVSMDLAHGPDGRWWVVSHRTQSPSGLGYLLENRITIGAQFASAFNTLNIQRLGASYLAMMQGLRSFSPKGEQARIALLTPGPYNETYFEHAYLARYLGLPLVEGNDLTVRDQRVFLKTLHGLEPIDILMKRLGDEWLDPLELRADSALGVPGLLQAVRAGNLILANTPGSAPLESTALLGFLPAISQRLLGEPLRLPSLATWWCGEAASFEDGSKHLSAKVIKRTYPRSSNEAEIASLLNRKALAAMRARIQTQPDQYTLQSYLPLSQQPTWSSDGEIVPRSAMLRVFALCDGAQSWRVLPGGLVRLAQPGQAITSMRSGGGSADCWVQTQGVVDPTSLLPNDQNAHLHAQQKRIVSSRSAENLFWLGRYTERADNGLRLARLTLRLLQGERLQAPHLLRWLHAICTEQGLVPARLPDAPAPSVRAFKQTLIKNLGTHSGASSVGYNLRALRMAAGQVRERLSHDLRGLIERVDEQFNARHTALSHKTDDTSQEALEALDEASALLTAITGEQTDRMVRDDGWRMLSIGRQIERLYTLAAALSQALEGDCLHHIESFEALLTLFDSTITFHFQYQQRRDKIALLDVLVVNRDNPRSLGWVLSTLRSRLAKLPRAQENGVSLRDSLPDPDDWTLEHLRTTPLLPLLKQLETVMLSLSDQLSQRYFSHADRINTSLMT